MNRSLSLRIENEFAVIEFDQLDSKVNVLSALTLTELEEIIAQLKSRQGLLGVLILSKKPDIFIAGGDIKEIEKMTSISESRTIVQAGQRILNALEELPIPSIALINGACLGGGLELALVCDYRLASFSDKVKLGLPEVKLGVLPGFGGTKRLSRLVGLRKGLEMILSGGSLSASEAKRIGLVDGLVPQNRLLEEGIEFLRQKGAKRKLYQPRLKGWVNIFLDKSFLGRIILRSQSKKFVLKSTRGHYPAPLKIVDVVVDNYSSSLAQALAREVKAFGKLATSEIAKNLISVFYLVEKYKKAKWVDAAPRKITKYALLGAGVMGGGIAQLFSFYGLAVRMKDLNYPALGRGLRQAKEIYDYALKKKKIKAAQANFGMALISTTTDYSGFSSADLIVEAVAEDMRIKKAVWKEVSVVARPDAILASNTSSLSISSMTEGVENKARIIGMHFFNPVQRMPLVEVIRTAGTSDETVATVVKLCRSIGKTPIVVKDSCGFLVNRILLPYLNEAGFLLEEGVSFARVDNICLGFGMPMGPFTLMDEIGLDVGYKVALVLEENFSPRMKVAEILKQVYERRWLGKKSGRGFYIYKGKGKIPNQEIYNFMPKRVLAISDEDILKRMLYKMINEAGRCLEEKVCNEPADVDIGMIMGTGFPPFRAGLLRYADSIGLDKIVVDLEKFQEKSNLQCFSPCGYLVNLAREKGKFYK